MSDPIGGYLEVGTNDRHEVVVNLGEDRTGHVVFSIDQARQLARTLNEKANAAAAAQFAADEARRIAAAPPVDRTNVCTTSGEPAEKVRAEQTEDTGQHKAYIVLCAEERAKGFVRPYRDSYKHVGRSICGKLIHTDPDNRLGGPRPICDQAHGHDGPCDGAFRTVSQPEHVDIQRTHTIGGCGTVTTMGRALSETYARDPKFYGATFCAGCNRHLPVDEFVWTADGERVGS